MNWVHEKPEKDRAPEAVETLGFKVVVVKTQALRFFHPRLVALEA